MKKNSSYLIYAGAIPFIVCSLCIIAKIEQLPLLGSVEKIFSVYGLVILSFLSGSYWGHSFHLNKLTYSVFLKILSNILVLLLCVGFLLLSFKMLMILFAGILIVALAIDKHLLQTGLISHNYFYDRCWVSVIVIISLIISGVMS